jgi:hypothetical protein
MADFRFPIEAGHILLFARAAGVPEPDVEFGSLTAPPTFVQCGSQFDPDWMFRPHPDTDWIGSGREPTGRPDTQLGAIPHAEQHFEYHQPVRAGMVLTVSGHPGKTWTKSSRGGGQLDFEELITEYRDEAGELVVSARSVAVTPRAAGATAAAGTAEKSSGQTA